MSKKSKGEGLARLPNFLGPAGGLVLAIGELTLGGLLGGVEEFELFVGELG